MEEGYKKNLLKRIITSIVIILPIVATILFANIWIFSILISIICLLAMIEWIKNKFNKIFLGFLLILNFGFWSIYFISLGISKGFNEFEVYFQYGLIIFNTALFDTFAFIIGSKFGETYIVKKISPNKTLEGLVGGLLASLFFSILLMYTQDYSYLIVIYFILGGFFAFIGDLLISYFKRLSGTKDTGAILPGHGGILDRIDSHLLATPLLIIISIVMFTI
ncbi:MAG: phosphatidate cytidylyltransferase [Gammaproteobacteria bacterium]|nr:phosphatidate cytidylyltransferase [Gammaproteobacteria bacterium]